MKLTDDLLQPAANNLTLARLILASSVIYTHSHAHFRHADTDDLTGLLGSPVSHYGVDGFFILSGFLVYRSIVQNPSIARFARARLTRLLPGMALMIAIVIAAGAWVTRAPLPDYLTGTQTLRFAVFNLSLVKASYMLTGVTCGGSPCAVNESLWTLPWEARCYVVLALLSAIGLTRRRAMLAIVLPLSIGVAAIWPVLGALPEVKARLGPSALYFSEITSRLWGAFALGMVSYELRDRLRLSWGIAALLFVANLLIQAYVPLLAVPARQLFIAYLVFCLGFLSARNGAVSARWPDYSYGMYIYGFPAMLAVAALLPITSPHWLALTSVFATLPLAALSWHLVEKPALDWLRRRQHTAFKAAVEPEAAPDPLTEPQTAGN